LVFSGKNQHHCKEKVREKSKNKLTVPPLMGYNVGAHWVNFAHLLEFAAVAPSRRPLSI